MGTIVYLSIRLACACYILYKVCGQKKKIREICDLLYAKLPPVKKKEPENVLSEPSSESSVMGSTRFVYLDEDAGKRTGTLNVNCHPKRLSGKYTGHVQMQELWNRTEKIVEKWL